MEFLADIHQAYLSVLYSIRVLKYKSADWGLNEQNFEGGESQSSGLEM